MPLRILVVDDHDVVRQGVRLILRCRPDWEICGEAESGAQALEREKQLKPDLIILDISMPGQDGLDVATELRARKSTAQIVVLTMHESRELASAVQAVGAVGYVIKSHAARDLVKAIQTIVDGGQFFSVDPAPLKPGTTPSGKKPSFLRTRLIPAFGMA
jgi:two-component system, NarL family, nitrate/nitrite response regulator NarL